MANPRKSVRFKPDPLTIALLDFKRGKNFEPSLLGLVLNESYSGCALLLNSDAELKKGLKLRVKIGQLPALKGEIAWVKSLEENILKVGIKILE